MSKLIVLLSTVLLSGVTFDDTTRITINYSSINENLYNQYLGDDIFYEHLIDELNKEYSD